MNALELVHTMSNICPKPIIALDQQSCDRKGMSQCSTNEQRDYGSSRCFSVVSYAEPKMNLTTQIAKCIGSAHLRLIV